VAELEYVVENFGPVLLSITSCTSCGYRHTDVSSLSTHDPTYTRLRVESTEDLKIHVVRGNTATVVVPELGVSIHPGLNNEGFISNVEGVLSRIEDVLRFLSRPLEVGKCKKRSELLLKNVQRAREGMLRFTLVLKDPFGNSTIISEKAKKRRISARELKGLKFGDQAIAARKMP
jgi:zinc finger protein